MPAVPWRSVDSLLDRALAEDIGRGDVTSLAAVPAGLLARGTIVAKAAGVVAGLPVAARVFARVSRSARLRPLVREGARVRAGTALARVRGPARAVLAAERTALNLLGRLSGIATLARRYADAVAGTRCAVLDTRKTTPLWRALERAAVRAGGGRNHRFDLHDQALVKTNHLRLGGGVAALPRIVAACRRRAPGHSPVIVEARDLREFRAATAAGADVVLLDNVPDRVVAAAVRERGRRRLPLLEVSGGITPARAARLARLGADRVSVGALTHSAPALDVSLRLEPVPGR
ncbi:MAG: carboxylating nicotinate-nucleotide diphosphorylase [Planctomycetales bacterium]|nr:carboxylating nicotinate-nucleotide diphosphorylase [Planctomycetales bacterium]